MTNVAEPAFGVLCKRRWESENELPHDAFSSGTGERRSLPGCFLFSVQWENGERRAGRERRDRSHEQVSAVEPRHFPRRGFRCVAGFLLFLARFSGCRRSLNRATGTGGQVSVWDR